LFAQYLQGYAIPICYMFVAFCEPTRLTAKFKICTCFVQVLLRNPQDPFVIPFVEELRRRLPVRESGIGHEGSDGEGREAEINGKGMSWSPCRGDQDDNVPGADGILL
jgi:hypothetical protein